MSRAEEIEAARVEPLDARHNERMIAINRACPIRAEVTVCFDRQPDFFEVPRLHWDDLHYLGLFVRGELIGYGMIDASTRSTASIVSSDSGGPVDSA